MWHGRAGTRIPESGLAVLTFPSVSDLALGGSAALDGAGATGDLIGTAVMPFITMAGTSRGAERFITGAASTAEGLAAEHTQGAAESTTVPAQPSGRSTETHERRSRVRRSHADKAACARAPSAATAMAAKPGTFRRAARPALVEEPAVEEAEAAGIDNPGQLRFSGQEGR